MVVTFNKLGRYGRFANQLWQIAGVIGIARHPKNNCEFAFPEWKNYDHLERFGSSEDIDVQKYFVNPLPVCEPIANERFVGWGYHPVILNGDTSIEGHLQSEKYFEHCADEVKHYLTMKDEYPKTGLIAIHYRAGDYQAGPDAYHPRMTMEYYNEAMNRFKGCEFVVFSDDRDEARKMFGNMVYEGRDYIDEFKAMKSCSGFICANSSYSVMAAVLSPAENKQILCPSRWFGPVAGITARDIYPKGSIII